MTIIEFSWLNICLVERFARFHLCIWLALPLLVEPNVPLPLVFAMIARAAAPISGSASWLLSTGISVEVAQRDTLTVT